MSSKSGIPKTILVVEDSQDDFEVIQRSFKAAKLDVNLKHVENGMDALNYLRREKKFQNTKDSPRPGLIFLDLNLPGIDGREVLKDIKTSPNFKTIPVIVLTTSDSDKDIRESYEMGANSYMQKPADYEGFIEAVKKLSDFLFKVVILPEEGDGLND